MKYVVTGSTGHISKPLTEHLVKAGHQVTVISSSNARVSEIEALGATAAIGNVEDVDFLSKTFAGADVVYTMVPPTLSAADWKGHIHAIGKNFADAIVAAGVKKVVNLSSIGAHMPAGCGPVSGLHHAENELNKLQDVAIKHLRPAYFFTNLYAQMGMIKHMGIMGGNFGDNTTIVFTHPADIAVAAAEEMLNPSFTGHSIRYIASDERTTNEVASVLGSAIGKPELPWVSFKNEDALGGMLQAGLSQEVASNYVEMGAAMANGTMAAEYINSKPALSNTKLEDFAREFAVAFSHS